MRLRLRLVFVWCLGCYAASSLTGEMLPCSPRQELTGNFVVCAKAHTMHAGCYDRYERGCALCARSHKDPVKDSYEDTIFVSKSGLAAQEVVCSICLIDIAEPLLKKAPIVPTAPPISPRALDRSASASLPPHIYYARYAALQVEIARAKGDKKVELLAQARAMQAAQFRHPRK